ARRLAALGLTRPRPRRTCLFETCPASEVGHVSNGHVRCRREPPTKGPPCGGPVGSYSVTLRSSGGASGAAETAIASGGAGGTHVMSTSSSFLRTTRIVELGSS